MVDPIGREECLFPESDGFNTCVQASAEQFCARLHPPAPNCEADIAKHISTQLEEVDSKRLDEKCSYQRLGLEIDAPGYELYKKTATVARSRGMNISPFRRVDNGEYTHMPSLFGMPVWPSLFLRNIFTRNTTFLLMVKRNSRSTRSH